ncbi:MAG: ABC transporter permease [Alphaproteobacteria bacterium]|jgi:NitT/TauT family transport system permease protein|nr:ABC transporter permease [Alphaproteobacteria bacterium]
MIHERIWAYGLPTLVAVATLGFWEWIVYALDIKPFVLPAPSAIVSAAIGDWNALMSAAWVTIRVTIMAFVWALVFGIAFAILFAQSRTIESALFPYAVTLQVTPVVAIAPLILIWVGPDNAERAVLILATTVAFFPILANATLGLRSADRQLHELFDLYGANRWQRLIRLQFPAALPNILTGMKISGGLALIGAVVAEFAAGSGTSTGLAWVILQAGFNLKIAKAFAALALLSAIGIAIYASLSLLERQALKHWHESARPDE